VKEVLIEKETKREHQGFLNQMDKPKALDVLEKREMDLSPIKITGRRGRRSKTIPD